jgi:UDP-glucose 4-epimerase
MILVTGGLGFIGSHTTRALLDLGESCLLVQRRAVPQEVVAGRIVEQVDLADRESFLGLGRRHRITGIVHLAGSVPWPPGAQPPVDGARTAIDSLLTVVQAAHEWAVPRLTVASTIGVYGGVGATSALAEDLPLPMTSGHVIPAYKKIGELLTDHLGGALGLDIVNLRIGAIWGPGGRPVSPFFPAPQWVHAAASGTRPTTPAYADNGTDMLYAKDCGQAIALLQIAPVLHGRTYNVASGRLTTNREVADAIRSVVPEATIDLVDGRDPAGAHDVYLDVARIGEDTGFAPAYDTGRAVADYVDWLRAGNER